MDRYIHSRLLSKNLSIPNWMVATQCILFVLLWSITMLPHTLMLRNVCLILGAIIGSCVAISHSQSLMTRGVIPIALIVGLFLWVTFHLFWVGQNYALQLAEYVSIWKRALLGSLFAVGLGISLTTAQRNYFNFIFFGLCGPMLIYWFKFFAMLVSAYFDFRLPEALTLYSYGISSFYIPKISYVFFCLPAYAVALGCLSKSLVCKKNNSKYMVICIAILLSILGIFHVENIKNGFAYAFVMLIIFLISIFRGTEKKISWKMLAWLAILVIGMTGFIFNNYMKNDSWQTIAADFRVAWRMQPDQIWASPNFSYPNNEYGKPVSGTNFDRIFYLKTAIGFVRQHPMGFGLVQSSFGHIAFQEFPNAPLIQSHSGWMDLALGVGIPGVALLLIASIFAIAQVSKIASPWSQLGMWSLTSILFILITTEVAQKNYLETFVWFIIFVASMSLQKPIKNAHNASNLCI